MSAEASTAATAWVANARNFTASRNGYRAEVVLGARTRAVVKAGVEVLVAGMRLAGTRVEHRIAGAWNGRKFALA